MRGNPSSLVAVVVPAHACSQIELSILDYRYRRQRHLIGVLEMHLLTAHDRRMDPAELPAAVNDERRDVDAPHNSTFSSGIGGEHSDG